MPRSPNINDRVTELEVDFENIREDISNMRTDVKSILTAQQASQVTNWPSVLSWLGFGAVAFAGLYAALSGQQEVLALRSKLENKEMVWPVVVSAENSRTDREDLHDKIGSNATRIAAIETDVATFKAEFKSSLAEAEAQFRNVGNIINLRAAEQLRVDSLLWQETFKASFPDANYYPNMHREFIPGS